MKSVIQTYNKYFNSLYDFCHTKITSVALGTQVPRSGKLIKTLQLFYLSRPETIAIGSLAVSD